MTYPTYYIFARLHKFLDILQRAWPCEELLWFRLWEDTKLQSWHNLPYFKNYFQVTFGATGIRCLWSKFQKIPKSRQWKASHPQPLTPATPRTLHRGNHRYQFLQYSSKTALQDFWRITHSKSGIYSMIIPLEHTSKYFIEVNSGIVKDVQAENV